MDELVILQNAITAQNEAQHRVADCKAATDKAHADLDAAEEAAFETHQAAVAARKAVDGACDAMGLVEETPKATNPLPKPATGGSVADSK